MWLIFQVRPMPPKSPTDAAEPDAMVEEQVSQIAMPAESTVLRERLRTPVQQTGAEASTKKCVLADGPHLPPDPRPSLDSPPPDSCSGGFSPAVSQKTGGDEAQEEAHDAPRC